MRAMLTCALVLFALTVNAHDRDGNWWKTQTHTDKASYVLGFLDGQDYAL
jgi:hypothetical protein